MFADTLNRPAILPAYTEEKMTIGDLMASYIYYGQHVRGMAKTTLKSRIIYLRQFHTYLESMGIEDITKLTNTDLDMYFIHMGKRVSYKNEPLSTHSINASKRAIKGFLKWCLNYCSLEPAVVIEEIRERKVADKKPNILTHEQILYVIKKIENHQDRLLVSVIYEAGLRISEAMELKIEDIRGTTLDIIGKGSKHRITFISLKLAEELHGYMADKAWGNGYIFRPQMHGEKGEGYKNSDTVRRRIKFYFKKYLNREMHPHMLRHAFALRLLEAGCNLRSIQKMLGHSKIETTMVYLNINDSHLYGEYQKGFTDTVYA